MFRWQNHAAAELIALVTVAYGAVACGVTAEGSTRSRRPQYTKEAEVFAAAVHGVQKRWPHLQRMDPRPIELGGTFEFPSEADYYDGDRNVQILRKAILRDLGIDLIRAFPLLDHCTGMLVPPGYRETRGCPQQERFDLAFDRVRPTAQADRWILRMIEIDYRPYGRSATLLELTIALIDGSYTLESADVLISWD